MIAALKSFAKWTIRRLGGNRAEQAAPGKPLQVSALPAFTQIAEGSCILPENGRKLLMPAPLEDAGLLIGRDEQLAQLEEALNHWKQGQPTSVALVGPQGCGKTSLINCFVQKLEDPCVLRCDMEQRLRSETAVLEFFCRLFHVDPPVDDVEGLIERLNTMEPGIVVIEHAHNLLLRVIGGRKAIDAFLYTLLCTRQRHLWVVSCRLFPWRNMDRHVQASQYFSHLIAIDPLPEGGLRDALALRLEKSGLKVIFCRHEEDIEGKAGRESVEAQEGGEDFYQALYSNSGGNVHAALYFLLLCSRYEADTGCFYLWPPHPLDVAFVKEMNRLHQLSLVELVAHGVLSPGEHARIFRTGDLQSKMILAYLEQLNLLRSMNGRGGDATAKVYDLSPVLHHAVTSVLQQLNLLY